MRNQVSLEEQFIYKQISAVSMLTLLEEVPRKKFHLFQSWRTFLENMRTTVGEHDESSLENLQRNIGKSEFLLKSLRRATMRSKIRGVETIGVAKIHRNIAQISFGAKFN